MRIEGAILDDGTISVVDDIELEPPREGEALVEIASAGICGSDLALLRGKFVLPTPVLLGHEAAGRVLELGPNTTGPAPGSRVTLWMRPPCRQCRACRRDLAGLCEASGSMSARGTLLDGRTALSREGQTVYRGFGVAAFATHVVMPVNGLIEVPDGVSDEVAALVSCGVATGFGAIANVAQPRPDDTVLVFGAGGVGLSAVMAARAASAGAVIVCDPEPHRRALALTVGATHAFEPGDKDHIRAQLREAIGVGNVDVVIDTAGRPEIITLGHSLIYQGGAVVAVGLQLPGAEIVLNAAVVPISHKRLLGCFMGGIDPQRDLPTMFDLHLDGKLPIDRLITHHRPLAATAAAFEDMAAGTGLRTMITLHGSDDR